GERAVSGVAAGGRTRAPGGRPPPIDAVARRLQARYTADWRPVEFAFDGTVRGQPQSMRTVVDGSNATSTFSAGGSPSQQKNDTIDPASVLLLTNSFFGSFEAVAARIRGAAAGTAIPAYPQASPPPFQIRL